VTVGLESSPSEVQQALQSGQVTQKGTTTVNGTQAIALSIKTPGVPTTSTSPGTSTRRPTSRCAR
jgi:hypothetical protein